MKKHFFPVLIVLACLTMFCTEDLLAPLNNKPRVSLQLSKAVIVSNDSVTVSCIAEDDEGDTLKIDWSAKLGSFTEKSKKDTLPQKINWKADNLKDGSYYVRVSVSDQINQPVFDSIKIIVHNNLEYPIKPELISPFNNKKNTSNSVKLIWKGITVKGKTLKYNLYWGKDKKALNVKADLTDTTYTLSNLKYNTKYYWFVKSKYNTGKYTDSDTNSFATRKLLTADLDPSIQFIDVAAGNFKKGKKNVNTNIGYSYKIMKYEVTNKTYITFLNSMLTAGRIYTNTAKTKVFGFYDGDQFVKADTNFVYLDVTKSDVKFENSKFSVKADSADYPVTGVTWYGARAFAKYYKLNLPTELEWEKAARGNTGKNYPASDILIFTMANVMDSIDTNNDSKLDTVLNIFGGTVKVGYYNGINTLKQGGKKTVDYKSPFGAYDMAGNVLEWISDIYSGRRKTAGGSFKIRAQSCKSWQYHSYEPAAAAKHLGFRCIKK